MIEPHSPIIFLDFSGMDSEERAKVDSLNAAFEVSNAAFETSSREFEVRDWMGGDPSNRPP